jgi:hypothetical protein
MIPDPIERASFRLVMRYMLSDRFVMQQLYPQLAFLFIYPLVMVFGASHRDEGFSMINIGLGAWLLSLTALTVLDILRRSEHSAAGVLFAIAPLPNAARLFHGARKAVLYCIVWPSAAAMFLLFRFFTHQTLESLLICLPLLLLVPTLSLLGALSCHWLPLSLPPRQGQQVERMALVFGTMFLSAIVIVIAYLLSRTHLLWLLFAIEIPALAILHPLLLHHINRPRAMTVGEEQQG